MNDPEMQQMDDLTFIDKLKEVINTQDVEALSRLCCNSSKRNEILTFTDDDGNSLLCLVAGFGTVDLMRTLIDMGANEYDEFFNLENILQTACSHGNTEVVEYLLQFDRILQNDTTKTECNETGYANLFYYAARSWNILTIKCLQNNGHLGINQFFSDGSTALLRLVKENDCKGVETLCLCGADVNIGTINSGLKAIHLASESIKNGAEMIQILLQNDANVNEPFITPNLNQQPLFMALKAGYAENASVLIEFGADISFQGKSSKDIIGCFCLAIKNCPSLVPDLIKRGANLYETYRKFSVLMVALYSNAGSEAIEALVKAGANLKFGIDGKTVIQCCTHYDQLQPFRNAGISVMDIESKHKVSTLGLALNSKVMSSSNCCHFGRSGFEFDNALPKLELRNEKTKLIENEVRDLISNGANPAMSNEEHDRPLITAIKRQLLGVFKMLIATGVNKQLLGKDGNSAIHVCCIESNWKFLELLIEGETDLNQANAKGDYPLELALKGGRDLYHFQLDTSLLFEERCVNKTNPSKDIIARMLEKGANPNLTGSGKNSPLICAILKGLDSIVDVLLHADADIFHIGENESTAFEFCFRTRHEINIKAFIEKGISLKEPSPTGKYPLELLINKNLNHGDDCSLLLIMLANGADPNTITAEGDSVLTKALRIGLIDISMALLDAGADVNHKGKDGCTAFDIFAKRNVFYGDLEPIQDEIFKKFVLAGIDVNQHNMSGSYPLLMAVSHGKDDIVKLILETGGDVNIVNQSGEAPLTEAISRGLDDTVQLLLDYGANVNQICKGSTKVPARKRRVYNEFGISISESEDEDEDEDEICENTSYEFEMSLLSKVITSHPYGLSLEKRRHFVDLLLELGADPNLETSGVDSCLMHAVRFGDPVLVKTLLEANAETGHIGNNGCTVLHVFFMTYHSTEIDGFSGLYLDPTGYGSFEENRALILKILLEHGAPVNVASSDGDLPVLVALSKCKTCSEFENNLNVIMAMIDLTKDLNIPGKNSSTPFLTVIRYCSKDVLEKMVQMGADVRSKGTNGNTALHIVMEKRDFNKDIISRLLIHGADINAVNNLEETPLVTFIKRGSSFATVEYVSFLVENGANPNVSADGINSALLEAISFPSFDVVWVLIDAKANVNHIGNNGNTALHAVYSKACKKMIQDDLYDSYDSDEDTSADYEYAAASDSSLKSCDGEMNKTDNNSNQQKNESEKETTNCHNIEGNDKMTNLETQNIEDTKKEENMGIASNQMEGNVDTTSTEITAIGMQNENENCEVLEATVRLVNAGVCINILNKDGHTPLYYLIEKQDMSTITQVLPYLLKKGADPSLGDDLPLIAAANLNQTTTIKMLLAHGVDVDKKNSHGNTALTTILDSYSGFSKGIRKETVFILLNAAASVSITDSDGKTPLVLLIKSVGQYINNTMFEEQIMEMVSELTGKGADPNSTPLGEDSALILAVEYMFPTVVQILLESGADTNHIGQNGQNVLHSCFRSKERIYLGFGYHNKEQKLSKILDALLAKTPNVNLKDNDGFSPLELAIQNQKVEGVEKLISAYPDILQNKNDKLKVFEMCIAIDQSLNVSLKILDTLTDHLNLDNNVDVFFRKFWKYIKTENVSSCKDDLDNVTFKILSSEERVHVNLENNLDDSPLIYFCQIGCPQAVKMLLVHKADVNHVGKSGTALHYIIDLTDDECAVSLFDCLLKENPCLKSSDNKDKTVIQKAIAILCGKRDENLRIGYQYYASISGSRFKTVSSHVKKLLDAGLTLDLNDLNDALLMCAKKSDFKGMECFLLNGGDCCKTDENGKSILHLCWSDSLDGGLEFLQFFVETQHSLNRFDSVDNSILLSVLTHRECYGHEFERVKEIDRYISDLTSFLIKHGACCVADKEGNGPLHIAAEKGYLATIDVLLKLNSGSVYGLNKAGQTALHICLKHPKENVFEVVKRLFESRNAKLWLKLHEVTVLYLATVAAQKIHSYNFDWQSSTFHLVKLLLENGADPNNHSEDDIPLLSALEARDLNTSTLLLEASANINATNRKGKSGLHIILENYEKENDLCLTKLLVEKDINANLVDKDGKSPMIVLVEKYDGYGDEVVSSFEDILKVLVDHGADLNLYNTLEQTVLSYFCESGTTVEIGNILLRYGADPKIGFCLQNLLQNNRILNNETSSISFMSSLFEKGADANRRILKGSNLIDSVQKRYAILVEELIKYGAQINYCDETKKTALHYACNLVDLKEKYEITAFLVKHGSYLNAASNSGERPLDVVVQNMIKEMTIEVHKATEDNCRKITVDLSVLNLLVCGGADLCPLITESNPPYCGNYLNPTLPVNIPTTYKSALLLLISHGLFQTAEFLLRCGWDVEKEEWFDAFDVSELDLENIRINYNIYKRHDIEAKKAEFKSFLQNFEKGPKSLAITCRKQIRHQLLLISNGTEIETKISTLPLPVKIKRFLSLRECIQENEIILLENDERTETNTVNAVQVLQALGLFGGLFPMQLQYDSDDYFDGQDYYYTDINDY